MEYAEVNQLQISCQEVNQLQISCQEVNQLQISCQGRSSEGRTQLAAHVPTPHTPLRLRGIGVKNPAKNLAGFEGEISSRLFARGV
jgi:hypothetical protein